MQVLTMKAGIKLEAQRTQEMSSLYEQTGAAAYGLSLPDFITALDDVATRCLPVDANQEKILAFYRSLHLNQLALARACAQGMEAAWAFFVDEYRDSLYTMALTIAREASAARDLADSVYADLFGTKTSKENERVSKLRSYTGRGSFEGWLRTVLAQEYVNRFRKERRLVSLNVEISAGPPSVGVYAVQPLLNDAIDQALGKLSAEERFCLAAYYLDGRTLEEIGRALGLHESTISRRLESTTSGAQEAHFAEPPSSRTEQEGSRRGDRRRCSRCYRRHSGTFNARKAKLGVPCLATRIYRKLSGHV